mgnify:CR=1 FL=1
MLEELREFISKAEFAKSECNPLTEAEFNYLFKNREHNGFSEAFLKVSKRSFFIHLPTFVKCLSERLGK